MVVMMVVMVAVIVNDSGDEGGDGVKSILGVEPTSVADFKK